MPPYRRNGLLSPLRRIVRLRDHLRRDMTSVPLSKDSVVILHGGRRPSHYISEPPPPSSLNTIRMHETPVRAFFFGLLPCAKPLNFRDFSILTDAALTVSAH